MLPYISTFNKSGQNKSRVPNKNGVSSACYNIIVEIYHSGPEPSKYTWCTCVSCLFVRGYLVLAVYRCSHSQALPKRSAQHLKCDHIVSLVVKASASRAEDHWFEFRLRRDLFGSSHPSDIKIGTPVATLPGAWRYRVSAGTGRPGVSMLRLGEVESLICNFNLSVAARKIV